MLQLDGKPYFGALLGEFTRKELALYCKKVLLIQEFLTLGL